MPLDCYNHVITQRGRFCEKCELPPAPRSKLVFRSICTKLCHCNRPMQMVLPVLDVRLIATRTLAHLASTHMFWKSLTSCIYCQLPDRKAIKTLELSWLLLHMIAHSLLSRTFSSSHSGYTGIFLV